MHASRSQYERLLQLDREIRNGNFPSTRALADALEVSCRTVYRDVEFMRDRLRAPLEFNRGRNGYFYSNVAWSLPTLSLGEMDLLELRMAILALGQYEGTPLAANIEALVHRHVREAGLERTNQEIAKAHFSFMPGVVCPVDGRIWMQVVEAIHTRRTLSLEYRTSRDEWRMDHIVDPLHLTNLCGVWYLLAHSHSAGAIRQYALTRIRRIEKTGAGFTDRSGRAVRLLLDNAFGRIIGSGQLIPIRIQFDRVMAPSIRDWRWHRKQTVEDLPNGDFVLSFPAEHQTDYPLRQVVQWVLSWGSRARVLEPESLRQAVALEIRRMATLYGD